LGAEVPFFWLKEFACIGVIGVDGVGVGGSAESAGVAPAVGAFLAFVGALACGCQYSMNALTDGLGD